MRTFIGIDVRRRQHYAVAITDTGSKSFVFTHRRVGFENFSKWVAEACPLPRIFALNVNEPFSGAVAAWLRYNGETVHVIDGQMGAYDLALCLRDGAVCREQKQDMRELLDLAMLYLRISVAAIT